MVPYNNAGIWKFYLPINDWMNRLTLWNVSSAFICRFFIKLWWCDDKSSSFYTCNLIIRSVLYVWFVQYYCKNMDISKAAKLYMFICALFRSIKILFFSNLMISFHLFAISCFIILYSMMLKGSKVRSSCIQKRIQKLRCTMSTGVSNPFKHLEVSDAFSSLHDKYIVVSAKKASNNIVVIPKKKTLTGL